MGNPFYKLNKAVTFIDHNGRHQTLLQGQIFHWNHLRFVTAERDLVPIEIPRSKLNAAGARMLPCESNGRLINIGEDGPAVEIEQFVSQRKTAWSA